MHQAGVAGDMLPWRDVLHDGPVPQGLSLAALSQQRAAFIVARGWGSEAEITQSFIQRDQLIARFMHYDKVILWFEHDLYDQLQILQILDYINQSGDGPGRVSMICTDQYLGRCSVIQLRDLQQYEAPIRQSQLSLASEGWAAFRRPTPLPWHALLKVDTAGLPFLEAAILRQLQELPNDRNGLSRSAYQALSVIAGGEARPGRVFAACQDMEESIFMGDSSFWHILQSMLDSRPALLSLSPAGRLVLPVDREQRLSITDTGRAVLMGARNWLDMIKLDRWMGGTHLTTQNGWCWDGDATRPVQCDAAMGTGNIGA